MTRIEIIGIDKEKVLSLGAITVSKTGDVYHIHKFGDSTLKMSRHASGQTHWKGDNFYKKIRIGTHIKNFEGIESLGTTALNLNNAIDFNNEYKMKKCNGVFAVDIREYDSMFNLCVAMLTEKGLPSLYNMWKDKNKRQVYLYSDCHPMIGITAIEVKNNINPKKKK